MDIQDRLDELGWQIELSIRYHSRRYGFFNAGHQRRHLKSVSCLHKPGPAPGFLLPANY